MPQISTQEFERLPLRVHDFLAGVSLHDVWAIDLPRTRSGITLDEFLRMASTRSQVGCDCCENDCSRKGHLLTGSPVVRALLNIRFFVGRLFGWDREPAATAWETFTTRLTTADRSKSLVPAGTREGLFRVVYRFENEQLLELINRTAHAAALSALVETANAYRFYFGVYVCSVSRFTPVYMALIDPFRKLVVYPSLLRAIRAKWNKTFGTA
ncbi:MAG TPA: DUF2867 domain-containing protein [Terriglobales bacterium]|jgi:hypothetical protein|nr:DUF2867 domain-containing protein [Terriglobales bacterium]